MAYISQAEKILYKNLLKYIKGEDIKAQVKIGNHFVDFLLFDHIVVEVDGPHHQRGYRRRRDKEIDEILRERGYLVKRVPAKRIYHSAEKVAKEIASLIFPYIS
jgi:very-short-patch-repair endonuclease